MAEQNRMFAMYPAAPPPVQPPTAADLARLFGFSLDELALNRTGDLSARQRQTLVFRSIGYLVRGIALIVLSVVLAAYLTTLLHRAWQWVLFGVLCALIAWIAALLARAAYLILAHPTIHTVMGGLRRAGDANHPRILAGDTELRVSFRRWKRLAEAYPGHYRFYVGPDQSLLSVEPLSEESEI
jgi:hypothetical protein